MYGVAVNQYNDSERFYSFGAAEYRCYSFCVECNIANYGEQILILHTFH